jgi:hypothetical protein
MVLACGFAGFSGLQAQKNATDSPRFWFFVPV